MTFLDTSAFTTLDNANMENWQHAYRVWTDTHDPSVRKMMRQQMAYVKTFERGWDMRQPEIDALNERIGLCELLLTSRNTKIGALCDENERLRKDAERYRWIRDNDQSDLSFAGQGWHGATLDAVIDGEMSALPDT